MSNLSLEERKAEIEKKYDELQTTLKAEMLRLEGEYRVVLDLIKSEGQDATTESTEPVKDSNKRTGK